MFTLQPKKRLFLCVFCIILGIVPSILILTNVEGFAKEKKPSFPREVINLTTQNTFPVTNPNVNWRSLEGLRANCVTANVWTVGGWGLSTSGKMTVEEFIGKTEFQVEAGFITYLNKTGLDHDTQALVILDIEHPIHPSHFGDYLDDPLFDEIIAAFKLRISVVRRLLPDAELSLFGVVGPPNNADEFNANFIKRIEALRLAGELGLYDELDYLSPSLYVRWGPDDKLYDTNIEMTRIGIDYTESVTGKKVAPFLSLKVINKSPKTAYDGEYYPINVAESQLDFLRAHPAVEKILYWTPPVPDNFYYVSDREIHDFFSSLDPCSRVIIGR